MSFIIFILLLILINLFVLFNFFFLKLVIDTSDYSFSKVCFSFCWFLCDFHLCDDSVFPFHFFPRSSSLATFIVLPHRVVVQPVSHIWLWDPMDCSKPFYSLLSMSHVFKAPVLLYCFHCIKWIFCSISFLISNFLKFDWFQGARRCRGLYSLILNRKFSILVFRKQILHNTLLNLW